MYSLVRSTLHEFMPRGSRFKKPTDGSVFGKVIEGAIEDASKLLNAVDFIESPQGLNINLFPLQRLVVKCIFAVPIDYKPTKIPMWDVFREKLVREVTEEECLHILYEEGRCNVKDWKDIPNRGFNEAVIFAGRRGGKSQVVSAIGGIQAYRLLNVRSPQEYFDLVPGSHIDFTFLAQDEDGSSRLYEKLREDINRAPFFNPYLKQSSSSWMGFVSDVDRNKRDVTPSINVESFPCTTNSSRGSFNIFLALDEFAHFRSAKGSSSDEVYGAATPSTIFFNHAELTEGGWVSKKTAKDLPYESYQMYQDSLILSISSPWTKVGKMYDLHKQALDKGVDSGIFTIRVSTAEMNPHILSQTLHREQEKNPLTFKAEYGGQFLESSETYVSEAQIRGCTDVAYVKTISGTEEPDLSTARFNLNRFHPSAIGRQYFWAVDLGMMKDATAVAIGHLEYKGGIQPITLIYDYIDRMMVGEKFEGRVFVCSPASTST